MDTMTSTATKVVSSTKLLIATFAAFGAGAVALATVPLNNFWSGAIDPDANTTFDQNQLFVKSTTKYNGGSKTDYCYTFAATGKTYLMEGVSNKGNFQTWQKNCVELNAGKPGSNFKCVEGACVNMATLLPDLVIKDVKFDVNTSGERWVHITVVNEGQGTSQSVGAKFGEDPATNPGGLKLEWQDESGIVSLVNSFYLDEFTSGQVRVYNELDQKPESKLLITLDPFNKIPETNETNNTFFRDSSAILKIVAHFGGSNLFTSGKDVLLGSFNFTSDGEQVLKQLTFHKGGINSPGIFPNWKLKTVDGTLVATGIETYSDDEGGKVIFSNINYTLGSSSTLELRLSADVLPEVVKPGSNYVVQMFIESANDVVAYSAVTNMPSVMTDSISFPILGQAYQSY